MRRKENHHAAHQREADRRRVRHRPKREIVEKLTEAMVSIEGENMRPVTLCVIEEVRSGDWGVGGKPLTTADVKNLAAGQPAAV